MSDMYLVHAQAVYDHALANYNTDGWDFIVECREVPDMAKELAEYNVKTRAAAIRHFKETANLFAELRLNAQDW
jgi:hypothetical protein